MDCNKPQWVLEVKALQMALEEVLSSSHNDEDAAKVFVALQNSDEKQLDEMGVVICDTYAGIMGLSDVADYIESSAGVNLEALQWAFELGKHDSLIQKRIFLV